ncbi:Homeobox-leucine zipper protein HDG1 [Linum grandiflorum]
MEQTGDSQPKLNIPTGGSDENHADAVSQNGIVPNENSAEQPTRKRKWQRRTRFQINELESLFAECTHPSAQQYDELSKKLGMEVKQVKFWFQNRRTQKKADLDRHENKIFRKSNDNLIIENYLLKTTLTDPICNDCNEQLVRLENIRIKEEISRLCAIAEARGIPDFISSTLASTSSTIVAPRPNLTLRQSKTTGGLDRGQNSKYVEFALVAMSELINMANTNEPLWVKLADSREVLNIEEYGRRAVPSLVTKPDGLVHDATRTSDFVVMDSWTLIDLLMDANHWTEAFTGMVGKGTTLNVASHGVNGTKNGALQMMHAEFQSISPFIPVRRTQFLRFCQKQGENVWAIMDLSVTTDYEGPASMRLPSGCVIEDLANGCCKVTWVEHWLYDHNSMNQVVQSMVSSGISFGAKRWIATLQRYCESTALLTASANLPQDPSMITIAGKKSLLKLSRRMVNLFCEGISVGSYFSDWENVETTNVTADVRMAVRKNSTEPGDTLGVTLSASTSMWLPVSRRRLFEFVVNSRKDWDVLVNGATMRELVHFPKTNIHSNSVSVLHALQYGGNQDPEPSRILQEVWNDESSSVMVYAPVNTQSIDTVLRGGDSTSVPLLPCGFAIFPDGNDGAASYDDGAGASTSTGISIGSRGGCIVTVGFQMLVSPVPTTRVRRKSLETANELLSLIIQRIRNAFCIASV